MNQEELIREISNSKKEFITDAYSMSIGELISMYKEGELIINPIFQRAFRWTINQQSKLIESILIGVPLPSIFVYQNKDGKWEVVDGVQRLSTILQFVGELKDEKEEKTDPTILEETKILKSLKDVSWNDIPSDLQLDFKRSRIEVKIIKYLSDKNAKFEVFQRLNYSPTVLSGQEYRNALSIMVNENFYNWVVRLSNYNSFKTCIDLTERWLIEKYDQELVLRLFVFPRFTFRKGKVDEYLNDSIFYDDNSLINQVEKKAFNLDIEEAKFKKTFDLLSKIKGEDVFQKSGKGQQFLESYYEAIAIGLYWNIDKYDVEDLGLISTKIDELENQEDFSKGKGTGTNSEVRIRKVVPFGKEYFKK